MMNYDYIDCGDCLELMKDIPDGSIDMILCDLPYGTTACKWDTVIPFEPLWEQYNRIIKDNGAIVLFGSEPFSTELRHSNLKMFKYDWIWVKNNAVGFVNAKLKPMNKHEIISVFSKGKTSNGNSNNMTYFPQGLIPFGKEVRNGNKKGKDNTYWRPSLKSSNEGGYIQQYTNYPTTVLKFDKVSKAVHPTQKPVALLEYLIKTYTNEGDVVLDNCMGSGSTCVACVNTGRHYIGFEKEPKYFDIACQRLGEAEGGEEV
jgi:site-specific DNA-methyltransferase (adenine-specific)